MAQRAVDGGRRVLGSDARRHERARRRLDVRHQQRRRQPLAADVGDAHGDGVVADRHHVVVVAAEPRRRLPARRQIDAGQDRQRARQERLLDGAGVRPLARRVRLGAAGGASFVHLAADDLDQRVVVPRLRQVAAGAAAHRLDGGVDVGPAGHRHDRQVRVPAVHLADQRQAFRPRRRVARVVQVHQQQVELAGVDLARDLLDRRRARRLEAGRLQGQPQGGDDVRLIVGDQDAGGFVGGGGCRGTVVHAARRIKPRATWQFRQVARSMLRARSEHDPPARPVSGSERRCPSARSGTPLDSVPRAFVRPFAAPSVRALRRHRRLRGSGRPQHAHRARDLPGRRHRHHLHRHAAGGARQPRRRQLLPLRLEPPGAAALPDPRRPLRAVGPARNRDQVDRARAERRLARRAARDRRTPRAGARGHHRRRSRAAAVARATAAVLRLEPVRDGAGAGLWRRRCRRSGGRARLADAPWPDVPGRAALVLRPGTRRPRRPVHRVRPGRRLRSGATRYAR